MAVDVHVEPGMVFTEGYWGDYERASAQTPFRVSFPYMLRQTAQNLIYGVLDSSVGIGIKHGYHLPDSTQFDFTNPETEGVQQLGATVMLVDHETLSPANKRSKVSHVDDVEPGILDITPHALVSGNVEVNDEKRKIKLRQGNIEFTDGASVYRRRARIIGIMGLRNNTALPLEYLTFRLKAMNDWREVRPSRWNFARGADDLMHPHKINETTWLPGDVLSRIEAEVITHGLTRANRKNKASLTSKVRNGLWGSAD